MKKQLLLCVVMLAMVPALFAQTLLSKKGQIILPQKGDLAIGIDATPFLDYAGGLFSKKGADAPSVQSPRLTIFGKYFLNDLTALRGSFQLDFNSQKTPVNITIGDVVEGAGDTPIEGAYQIASKTDLMLTFGIERRLQRLNNRRVQFYYGADFGIGYEGNKQKGFANDENHFVRKSNRYVRLGLMAFVGIEYFCAPKISIGGELGYGVNCRFGIKDSYEIIKNGLHESGDKKAVANGVNFSSIAPGSIRVMFYF